MGTRIGNGLNNHLYVGTWTGNGLNHHLYVGTQTGNGLNHHLYKVKGLASIPVADLGA